jgi:hypothetical protein
MPKAKLFVVTDELQRVLERLPALEPKSQLDPLRPFILRWRREGRSYRNILAILKSECRVVVCYETVRKFVKSRTKPRKAKLELEFEREQTTSSAAPRPVDQSTVSGKRLSPEERAAQVEFIRSLNKSAPQEQPAKPRWNLDVDKPRTIHKP